MEITMKTTVLILTTLLFMLAACAPAAPATPNGVFEAGQVTLRPGQSLDDVQSGSVLTFVEIITDSRCPADAICVTSGFVQVLLRIEQGELTRDVVLTLGDQAAGDTDTVEVGGFTVTLVDVQPYPLASAAVDYADYTITLDLQAP
jgi:hypothetical protein